MIPTPVGMRCPECARERTQVRRLQTGGPSRQTTPATFALIGLNLLAFLAEIATGSGATSLQSGGPLMFDGGLYGPAVAGGEWYRIVSSGFLHFGLFHLGLNMLAIYFLGALLEPSIGTVRFLGIYVVSLLGGSLGVILIEPNSLAAGASGAVFGLLSAAFIVARRRGLQDVASQIGFYVVINIVFTFAVPGISIGAHLGGLVAGGIAGLLVVELERKRVARSKLIETAGLLALGVGAFVATVTLA